MKGRVKLLSLEREKKNAFLLLFARLLDKFLTLDKNNTFFCSRLLEIFVSLQPKGV